MSASPTARRTSSKRQEKRLFQLDKYWLGREKGSDFIFYYWYDPGAGRTRRKTTGERDLEKAKLWLAKLVLAEPPKEPQSPDVVPIVTVRRFYWRYHANKIRSQDAARRAFFLLYSYLRGCVKEGAPKVGDFSLARQHDFMIWCRDQHRLSAKSISTYLSYIKAAFRFAATPRLVEDGRGEKREVRILSSAPHIVDGETAVAKITALPKSKPRDWIPQDHELAAMIDGIEHEHVFRYVIMALNTWARPEAILELDVSKQVDFEHGLVDLNPPGRPQNNKRRPLIRLTNNLRAWLLYWNLDRPIVENGYPVKQVDNRTLKKAAARGGAPTLFTKYTFRHYMATRIRRVPGIRVDREERADWMGHADPEHRQTQWYESFDPDYLESCMRATDAILGHLDTLCKKRSLFPPTVDRRTGLVVIGNVADANKSAVKRNEAG